MADRFDPPRRPRRPPLPPRARRRWALAAAAGAIWLFFLVTTRSMLTGTVLLLAIAVPATVAVVTGRSLGIGPGHPWVRLLTSRPWRNGHDVLITSLRHLPDLFVVSPNGSWLAPNIVEVHMNPDDHAYLTGVMDPAVIRSSANEAYQAQTAAYAAQLAGPGLVDVRVLADEAVPAGRYRLTTGTRAGRAGTGTRAGAGAVRRPPAAFGGHAAPPIRDGLTITEHAGDRTARWGPQDVPTARDDPRLPSLRLVTGHDVTQTRGSEARAGRGSSVELRLPRDLTISRVHAKFTFSDGHWWITGISPNGLLLNGTRLTEPRVVTSGDRVGWGTHANAVVSLIQISALPAYEKDVNAQPRFPSAWSCVT